MEIRDIIGNSLTEHWIVLGVFVAAFFIQWGYYLLVYLRLPRHRPGEKSVSEEGVSVIICARNEAANLERFLPAILEQDHPDFEVVVVNDGSSDHTEEVLASLSGSYPQLRHTSVPLNNRRTRGKKLALTLGLKSARFANVVLTDADCYPAGNQWLSRMSAHLGEETDFVLGYGAYERRRGMLNALIRYETVFTAMQFLGFAIKGKPYMGVGRNLAYRKALFFDNKGFSKHYHVPSGDDDLFVNEHATGSNTKVELSREAFTYSMPETTFSGWIKQKRRHISAGRYYRSGSRFRLALEWFSRILMYVSLAWLLAASPWKWPAASLFGLLVITRLIVFKMGMRSLDEKHLLVPSLLFDLVMPGIMGSIWLSSLFESKHQAWS